MSVRLYDTLTASQCGEIEALYHLAMERAVPPFGLCLVLPEPGVREEDTFYVLSVREGALVSFLSVFCPAGTEAEISGFTHPDFRKRGLFSALLSAAKKELDARFGTPSLLYQCLTGDPDAEAFCRSRALAFCRGECLMEARLPAREPGPGPAVSFRPAGDEDRKLLYRLHEKAFGEPAEGFLDTLLSDPGSSSFLILSGKKTAGLFHLTENRSGESRIFYLCGFGLLPAFRGQGLGKAALSRLRESCLSRGRLFLQVSTANAPAYRLYRSMGFETVSRQDYYR